MGFTQHRNNCFDITNLPLNTLTYRMMLHLYDLPDGQMLSEWIDQCMQNPNRGFVFSRDDRGGPSETYRRCSFQRLAWRMVWDQDVGCGIRWKRNGGKREGKEEREKERKEEEKRALVEAQSSSDSQLSCDT
jgi:hypothetical protein